MKLAKWPSNWGPFLYALGSGGIIFKSAWGPDADLRAKVLIHLAAEGSWALIHTNVGVAVLKTEVAHICETSQGTKSCLPLNRACLSPRREGSRY
jgi:hypothetical protein